MPAVAAKALQAHAVDAAARSDSRYHGQRLGGFCFGRAIERLWGYDGQGGKPREDRTLATNVRIENTQKHNRQRNSYEQVFNRVDGFSPGGGHCRRWVVTVYRAWQRERQCDVSTELHECCIHISQQRKNATLMQGR